MPSLLETILTLLNVDTGDRFIQETMRAGPIDSIFYLIFFPTVFIILFIFILTNWILHGEEMRSKGLRILISVAIYAFIIMQGWFTLVILASKVWFIIIIVLFGFWIFTRHFTGRGGGGGGRAGGLPAVGGGIISGLRKKEKILAEIKTEKRQVENNLKLAERSVEDIKMTSKAKVRGKELANLQEELRTRLALVKSSIEHLEDLYRELTNFIPMPEHEIMNMVKGYMDKYDKLYDEIKR